jgi:hypothetical protein
MRYCASEKFEIIELVEQSSLSIRRTLAPIGIPRSTFYDWYSRYLEGGLISTRLARFTCLLGFRDSQYARSGLLDHLNSDGFDNVPVPHIAVWRARWIEAGPLGSQPVP